MDIRRNDIQLNPPSYEQLCYALSKISLPDLFVCPPLTKIPHDLSRKKVRLIKKIVIF